MSYRAETLTVRDRHIRLMRGGTGQPLLYLHDTFSSTWTPVHDALAKHYEVIFPIHPGCVGSGDLDDIEGMDDLVFHYLDVCAILGLQRPVLLGQVVQAVPISETALDSRQRHAVGRVCPGPATGQVDGRTVRLQRAVAARLVREVEILLGQSDHAMLIVRRAARLGKQGDRVAKIQGIAEVGVHGPSAAAGTDPLRDP